MAAGAVVAVGLVTVLAVGLVVVGFDLADLAVGVFVGSPPAAGVVPIGTDLDLVLFAEHHQRLH